MVWYVFRSSDQGFSAVQFGVATDFTAPGDYDGDGKFDFAVQRPGPTAGSQATFYILRTTDGGLTAIPWGISTGDLNADGYVDAFLTSSMNFWFRYGVNSLLLNDKGQAWLDGELLMTTTQD